VVARQRCRFRRGRLALGNGHRAELIDVLDQRGRQVDDLAAEIGQSVGNTSFHLRALATAGLVTTRRDHTPRWACSASAATSATGSQRG
jgi:DNA-binding transcriptional ArsR family regulator